ncbi:MAG: hypothetical protein EZS28_055435, partial [Streblomastix strix]
MHLIGQNTTPIVIQPARPKSALHSPALIAQQTPIQGQLLQNSSFISTSSTNQAQNQNQVQQLIQAQAQLQQPLTSQLKPPAAIY